MEPDLIYYIANSGQIEKTNTQFEGTVIYEQKAREYRLILWVLYYRSAQIQSIEEGLAAHHFEDEEKTFKYMMQGKFKNNIIFYE
jgi:hypothetical protein